MICRWMSLPLLALVALPAGRAAIADILEKGGSEDAMQKYMHFRGREPSVEPLLERRGLKR